MADAADVPVVLAAPVEVNYGKTLSTRDDHRGSSGIGLAIARQLVREGTSVCLLARNEDKLEAAKVELSQYKMDENQTIDTLQCDVTTTSISIPS